LDLVYNGQKLKVQLRNILILFMGLLLIFPVISILWELKLLLVMMIKKFNKLKILLTENYLIFDFLLAYFISLIN
jgi:hypothetical protein